MSWGKDAAPILSSFAAQPQKSFEPMLLELSELLIGERKPLSLSVIDFHDL